MSVDLTRAPSCQEEVVSRCEHGLREELGDGGAPVRALASFSFRQRTSAPWRGTIRRTVGEFRVPD